MRFTMRSRLSTSLPGLEAVVMIYQLTCFSSRSFLDSLFVQFALEDAVHIDTRRVDEIRFQLPHFDKVFDLCNCYFGSGGHHRSKVAGGLSRDEIAPLVALPGFYQREVGFQRVFHDVRAAVEFASLLVFSDDGADAGGREEGGNARAPRANPLGECSLRHQVELNLALENHLLQHLIFTDVGSDVLANLPRGEQQAKAKTVNTGVVADGR